jgi:hypothetical protein
VTNITYVNQRVNNGVTFVSRDTFVNARPVARNLGRFDQRQLANAPIERRVSVQPIRASVLGSGAPARFRPPQAIINRQVVATQRPMPQKQPFEQRQAAINMRTERPNQPQPLVNQGQGQGNSGPARPVARPQVPARPAESVQTPPSGMPRPEARPQRPIAPSPETGSLRTPAGPTIPRPPQGQARDIENRGSSQGWSHPQARPAPPVQQRNEAQSRDDENKFRNWQQQRQQAPPQQNRAVQQQRQPPAPRQQENRPKSNPN